MRESSTSTPAQPQGPTLLWTGLCQDVFNLSTHRSFLSSEWVGVSGCACVRACVCVCVYMCVRVRAHESLSSPYSSSTTVKHE